MVPFGTISASYDHIYKMLGEWGIPAPAQIPSDYQEGYGHGYYGTEFGDSPTGGILAWISNEHLRKEHEEKERAIAKLTKQQKSLQKQIDDFVKRCDALEQELKEARAAEEQDTRLIQKLSTKLEMCIEMLEDLGVTRPEKPVSKEKKNKK
jgi:hypothetical protein